MCINQLRITLTSWNWDPTILRRYYCAPMRTACAARETINAPRREASATEASVQGASGTTFNKVFSNHHNTLTTGVIKVAG